MPGIVRPLQAPLRSTSSSWYEVWRSSPVWASIDCRASKEVCRLTNCITSEAHSCTAFCSAPGICQIDTAPMSVEATFTGRHETFQYTKVSEMCLFTDPCLSRRILRIVFARFVRSRFHLTFLTSEQLPSVYNASRPSIQENCRIRVLISIAKISRYSTSVKLGMVSLTRYSASVLNK